MTDKQPEALRLADDILKHLGGNTAHQAAAELRRLHIEVERLTECLRRANGLAEHFERHWYLRGDQIDDLLEALRDFSDYVRDEQCSTDGAVTYSNTQINRLAFKARAAIAKATGENND